MTAVIDDRPVAPSRSGTKRVSLGCRVPPLMRLSRTSLLARLTAPDVPPVVLLEAPPGYGKSWLARRALDGDVLRLRGELGPLAERPSPASHVLLDDAHLLSRERGRHPPRAHRGRRRPGPPADRRPPRRRRHPRGRRSWSTGSSSTARRCPISAAEIVEVLPTRLGHAGRPPRRGVGRHASASSPRRSTRPSAIRRPTPSRIASRMVRAAGEAALHQLDVAPPLGRRPAGPGPGHRPGRCSTASADRRSSTTPSPPASRCAARSPAPWSCRTRPRCAALPIDPSDRRHAGRRHDAARAGARSRQPRCSTPAATSGRR